ncbi:methyltransferase protein [Lambiella insularis]|nr:methyltransferase protein [Lambiella insularis]
MDSPIHDDAWMPTFYVGQHERRRLSPITGDILNQAHECGYDMLTTPITTPYFHSRVLVLLSESLNGMTDQDQGHTVSIPIIPTLTTSDTHLTPENITSQLLAFVSPWIDLCSPDPIVSDISRQVLYLEIAYAAFCGIEYVFIPGPRLYHEDAVTHGTPQYARAIQEALSIGSHLSIHIMLPMIDNLEYPYHDEIGNLALAAYTRGEYIDDPNELKPQKPDIFGTWDAWNTIRTVSLSISNELPNLSVQSRWYSEPVKLVSMSPKTFEYNKVHKPVLSKPHQSFISRLMRIKNPPWFLLCDVGPIPGSNGSEVRAPVADHSANLNMVAELSNTPTPAEAAAYPTGKAKTTDDPAPFLSYLRYFQRRQPPRNVVEKYGSGYQDYLQVPLQPLTDNLESMTYEVFEKDPVKYDHYEQAIQRALRDWKQQGKSTSSPDGKVVVAVAGAGRGPLVERALRASEAENVEIELWAVEKNPNAYVLLQRHNSRSPWNNRVTIVQSDMRSWKGPYHSSLSSSSVEASHLATSTASLGASLSSQNGSAHTHHPIDILVSELLGSFADNELSPECLDGILHLLNPVHGISIPRSYTAYFTPIAAPKLHADISSRMPWDPTAPDTPAVVWLHAIDYLSLAAKPLEVPKTDSNGEINANKDKGKSKQSSATPPAPSSVLSPTPAPTPLILPAWSFHHTPLLEPTPYPNTNTHNKRHTRLSFRTRNRGVCHGLGGYFEAVLYPGIELSTNPDTMEQKSPGMISWFPIFFPLRTPLYVPDYALVVVNMWRQTDGRKVWYEWMVEVFGYNLMVGGEKRLVRLGGGELGSSIKGGCLM